MANLKIYKFDHVVILPIRDTGHNLKEETAEQQTCGREIFTLSAVLPKFFFHLVKELDSSDRACASFSPFFAVLCQDKWRRSYASR